MRVSYIRYAFVGLLVVLIYSCPAYSGVIRDGANDQDYLNLGADPLYASVGRVDGATASYGFLASGVLIAPDWVLTAAHVVRGAKSLEFTVGGATYAASGWVANSKYASSKLAAGYDIGLIHLATPVTDVAPAVRYSGSDEVSTAPLVGVSVGFGMTGIGSTGAATLDFQKRAGQNLVDAFYPVRKGTPNIILMDFDSGTSADNAYGSKAPLPLEYLIAPGDSGGGLFVESGSCW